MERMINGLAIAVCALAVSPLWGQQADASAGSESHPNHVVVVRISEKVFRRAGRPVDRLSPVCRTILGTQVQGHSRTVGQVHVDLQEQDNGGSFVLRFAGATRSRTVGVNGPAVIHCDSEARFHCAKRIVFDVRQGGFRAGETAINCWTSSHIRDIGSTRGGLVGRIVERVAWNRALASQPQADAISNEMTKREITQQFDAVVDQRLAELNQSEVPQLVLALLGGAIAAEPSVSSTSRYLQFAFRREGTAPEPIHLPEEKAPESPIEVWMHASLINDELPEQLKRYESLLRVVTPLTEGATLSRVLERTRNENPPQIQVTIADGWFVLGLQRVESSETRSEANGETVSIER